MALGLPTLRAPLVRILAILALLVLAAVAVFFLTRRSGEPSAGLPVSPSTGQPVNVPVRADADADGLTDDEEQALGTDPKRVDSDSDGLSDYEEAKVYGTGPKNPDSDGDGHTDGAEVLGGFNPKGEGPLLPSADAIRNLNAASSADTNA